MRKFLMRLSLFICLLCLMLSMIGCNNTNISNSNDDISGTTNNSSNNDDYNSSNIDKDNSNNNLSSDNNLNEDFIEDNTMLVASIPQQFLFLGNIYHKTSNQVQLLEFNLFVGFLINESDLSFWETKDNDKSIMYALDNGNGVYRYEFDENLNNRFEIFSRGDDYDYLAVKDMTNEFIIYKKVGI